jgi:hypothetical protein
MQRPTRLFLHFLMLAAPATAIILAGVFFYGQLEIKREIGELELYEASELSLSGAATQQNLGAITSDMEFLSALYGKYSTSESPSQANLDALADSFAAFMNSHGIYRQIRWIDETGMERLRMTFDQSKKQARRVPKSELQNKSDRYYFDQANQIAPVECPIFCAIG